MQGFNVAIFLLYGLLQPTAPTSAAAASFVFITMIRPVPVDGPLYTETETVLSKMLHFAFLPSKQPIEHSSLHDWNLPPFTATVKMTFMSVC